MVEVSRSGTQKCVVPSSFPRDEHKTQNRNPKLVNVGHPRAQEGLPGPVTLSSNPKVKPNPPPSGGIDSRTDPSVSLFGSRIAFDGLGVVFDTSPNAPLWKRSDPRLTEQDQPWGVGASGVVSGIMDDGTGGWLDKNDRVLKKDDEAAYLERAIGECEAAFRNAQGLLWARISHVANTIRVRLPPRLSPS